jgi:spore germination protein
MELDGHPGLLGRGMHAARAGTSPSAPARAGAVSASANLRAPRRVALSSRWHRLARRSRRLVPSVCVGTLAILTAAAGFAAATVPGATTLAAPAPHHGPTAPPQQFGNRLASLGGKAVVLPAATAPPAPAPPALIAAPPIAAHEDFAFAPYWTLPQSGGFNLAGLTTLAYFSIGVNPDGSLDESGSGWNGYESQALTDLITRAHAAGERVVLTVNDFDQGSLDALTSSPTAPATLAAALKSALQAKNLDGVNFDFEGDGSADQAGLTRLIGLVSYGLRATDPHWQVTMDTYASSAGDPGGFYNIPALANSVDAFFVMAYELNLQGTPSPASPLTSGQFSDLTTLQQYAAAVPASKVILGMGFFGIDWPTSDGTMQATATGGATDIADSQVQSSGDPPYWDPVTDTGWTSYLVGTQWHESYWENPYGLYLVSVLAAQYGIRGVGIWALGMEDNDAQMIAALDGQAPAGGPGGAGPQATAPTSTTTAPTAPPAPPTGGGGGTTTTTGGGGTGTTPSTSGPPATTTTAPPPFITGTANGQTQTLTAVPTAPGVIGLQLGTLTNFATNEPAYACLVGGPPLAYFLSADASEYVVEASTTASPPDCMNQVFTFPN